MLTILKSNFLRVSKVANVIYLDAPTLTGYSYTKTPESVRSSDTLSASQTAEFLRKVSESLTSFNMVKPMTNY